MNYPTATPVAPQPYPPAPGYGYTPSPTPKRGRGALVAGLTGAILAAGLVGGGIGAFIAGRDHQPASNTAALSTDPHAQDVQLCTAYATINSALPKPQDSGLQVLPAANGLRLALTEAPNANPEIRSAITAVIKNYDALIAAFGKVRPRGLADPAAYDVDKAQQIIEAAWNVCQLDK